TDAGKNFITYAMISGMLIDMDHLSQNSRLDAYALAHTFGTNFPIGGGGGNTVDYPLTSIHTDIREFERSGPVPFELRNSLGFVSEITRTGPEFARVKAMGGVVAPGLTGTVIDPNGVIAGAVLPPDVRNDCDYSSKSWAIK